MKLFALVAVIACFGFTSAGLAAEPLTGPVSPGLETAPTPIETLQPGTDPVTGEGPGAVTKKHPMKKLKIKELKNKKRDSLQAPSSETK